MATIDDLNEDGKRVYGLLSQKLEAGDKAGDGSWQEWCQLAEAHAKLCESLNCPSGARAARALAYYYETGLRNPIDEATSLD